MAIMGYSTGILLESLAYGEDSKIQSLLKTGTMTNQWVPLGIGSGSLQSDLDAESLSLKASSLLFIKQGHLLVGDPILTNGYVDFTFAVENAGDFLANKITECIFQPEDDIPEATCIICNLTDINRVPVAHGSQDLTGIGLNALQPIVLTIHPIDEVNDPWANNVDNIHGVSIKVCLPDEGGQGCTPGFWKQDFHFGFWALPFIPTTDYEGVFGVDILIKKKDRTFEETPTFFESLEALGGAQNALARHSVAAILNAASPGTSFDFTVAGVIAIVQAAFASGDFEGAKNQLSASNEAGCPIGGQDPGDPLVNSFSETGGVDSTTYDGSTATPYEKKQYALQQLNLLVADPTISQSTIDFLNTAIVNLEFVVNNEDYWVNDYHLDIVNGQFILDNSKLATTSLIVVIDSGESQGFTDSVQNVIDELVAADSILAQTAINDIGLCGGKNSKIDTHLSNAQTKITQALQDQNDKKYDMAIQKFYDAWFEAFQATESCPSGYWTQLFGYDVVE